MDLKKAIFCILILPQFVCAHTEDTPPNPIRTITEGTDAQKEFEALGGRYENEKSTNPTDEEIHTMAFRGYGAQCFEKQTAAGKDTYKPSYGYFRFNVGRNPAWNGGDPQVLGHVTSDYKEFDATRKAVLGNPWGTPVSHEFMVDILSDDDQKKLQEQGVGLAYSQSFAKGFLSDKETLHFFSVRKDPGGKYVFGFIVETKDDEGKTSRDRHVYCSADPKQADEMDRERMKAMEIAGINKVIPTYKEEEKFRLWKPYLYGNVLRAVQSGEPANDEAAIEKILKEGSEEPGFPAEKTDVFKAEMSKLMKNARFIMGTKLKEEEMSPAIKAGLRANNEAVNLIFPFAPPTTNQATTIEQMRDRDDYLDAFGAIQRFRIALREDTSNSNPELRANLIEWVDSTEERLKASLYSEVTQQAPDAAKK